MIVHAAPTLAGLKTGNLFSCKFDSYDELVRDIRAINRAVTRKGLRLIPVRRSGKRALLYLYRPARLRQDLASSGAAELLKREGYTDLREDSCLRELMRRLQVSGAFPHEIGLFLSYPPEDVRGFIENCGHGGKCCGCWKVYGDVGKAQKTFGMYKKCTEHYRRSYSMGVPIERLAVVDRI